MKQELAIDFSKLRLELLQSPFLEARQVDVQVLRADLIHPLISGNKWYKLKYPLAKAREEGKIGLVTLGGPYSNHLLATAAAARQYDLNAIGIVRGEKPASLSPTLQDMRALGMELHFVSRAAFRDVDQLKSRYAASYPDHYWIPEGGKSDLGIQGASTLLDGLDLRSFSHLCCAVGTGTTMAGLLRAALPGQQVIGIPVLKLMTSMDAQIAQFIHSQPTEATIVLKEEYHEGGYAKYNEGLLRFMNSLYYSYQVPTDFVYTGKLFHGVFDQLSKGFFPANSSLLIIHSGGLQGNRSLKPGLLNF